MPMIELYCEWCENVFTKYHKPSAKKPRFCNRSCTNRARVGIKELKRDKIECQQCHSIVKKYISPSMRQKDQVTQFCSNACANTWMGKNIIRVVKEKKQICPECHSEFVSCSKSSYPKFCSRKCLIKAHAQSFFDKNAKEFTCKFCGCLFKRYSSYPPVCCTRSCSAKYNIQVGKCENFLKNFGNGKRNSKSQLELCDILNALMPNFEFQTGEKTIKINNKRYIPDIISYTHNIIIEYMGDYWHMNPEIYEDISFNQKVKLTAKEIWLRDKIRVDALESIGFKVISVWEHDFKKSKDDTILRLKEALNG